MEIPFHKPYLCEEEISGVMDTLRSGWLTMGPKTVEFERRFASYIGSADAVAVNSGTSALHLALKAIGLEQGDEVIVPTMTFTATAEVVCYFNAKPVLVDVEKKTCNISVQAIEKALSPKTKAIIPVHYGGLPCDMDAITDIAKSEGLYVIEDAAHSIPAWYKDRPVGTIGDLTCFSFYATKPLTTGEGGMVSTDNGEWAERIRRLRLHGIGKDAWKRYSKGGSWYYEVMESGYKYNMTDIQASMGLSQLDKIEYMHNRRRYISEFYDREFADSEALLTPYICPDRVSSNHLYALKIKPEALSIDRNTFIERLREKGVGTSVHFIPLHKHPFYREAFGYNGTDYPDAEWAYERLISLPIYPSMSEYDTQYVADMVKEIHGKHKK